MNTSPQQATQQDLNDFFQHIKRFRESGEIAACRRHIRSSGGTSFSCQLAQFFATSTGVQVKTLACKAKAIYQQHPELRWFLWAQAYLRWNDTKWKSVLWSTFHIVFGNHGCHVLWTKEERTIQTVIRAKPASVMVWGCVSDHGIMGNLHICERTINAEMYMQVLEQYVLPWMAVSFSETSLLISARQCQATFCTCYNSVAP